jgi:hypothetical protein
VRRHWLLFLLPSPQQRRQRFRAPIHLAASEATSAGGSTIPTVVPHATDPGFSEALALGLQVAAISFVKHEVMHVARWAILGKLLPKGVRLVWGVTSRHIPQIAGGVVGLLRRSGVIQV